MPPGLRLTRKRLAQRSAQKKSKSFTGPPKKSYETVVKGLAIRCTNYMPRTLAERLPLKNTVNLESNLAVMCRAKKSNSSSSKR
jgi:hypothetical protein